MGLPVAGVQVCVADRVATMEHPAVAHIDAHMRNTRCVIGADKEHQITGAGAARPGADVIKALRPQPPEAPAALIVDIAERSRSSQRMWTDCCRPTHRGNRDISPLLSEWRQRFHHPDRTPGTSCSGGRLVMYFPDIAGRTGNRSGRFPNVDIYRAYMESCSSDIMINRVRGRG